MQFFFGIDRGQSPLQQPYKGQPKGRSLIYSYTSCILDKYHSSFLYFNDFQYFLLDPICYVLIFPCMLFCMPEMFCIIKQCTSKMFDEEEKTLKLMQELNIACSSLLLKIILKAISKSNFFTYSWVWCFRNLFLPQFL